MRFANQVWNSYKDNEMVQNILETLMGAGISAGGQVLFTDMEPGEIATSTAIGAGLAMGARPLGTKIGRGVGGYIDRNAPGLLDPIERYVPITKSGQRAALDGFESIGMSGAPLKGMEEMLQAKRNHHAIRPDGTERGTAETILSYYGNTRADNLAQYGYAALAPMFMGNSGSETDETGMSYGAV